MDMPMTSSGMSMSATSTASSAMASMSGMAMDGGESSQSMDMDMSEMLMVFFTSTSTPLFSLQWTPANAGQYAGTCIFLIVFAAIFRGLLAIRSNFSVILAKLSHHQETSILRSDYDKMSPAGETSAVRPCAQRRPWRVNEALVRAILDTVLAGVSYLLMLAVMTMNVGYFLSVLGGVFLGSFAFGGWTAPAAH